MPKDGRSVIPAVHAHRLMGLMEPRYFKNILKDDKTFRYHDRVALLRNFFASSVEKDEPRGAISLVREQNGCEGNDSRNSSEPR